jgi:hypothetical protein
MGLLLTIGYLQNLSRRRALDNSRKNSAPTAFKTKKAAEDV